MIDLKVNESQKGFVASNIYSLAEAYANIAAGRYAQPFGIYDGDIVIVEQCETAENGEIVVAMVNGDEATVKRFYKENGGYRLQPENDSMEPIYVKEASVLGKVVALLRYFE